jgi:DUF1016 N-terminal domain
MLRPLAGRSHQHRVFRQRHPATAKHRHPWPAHAKKRTSDQKRTTKLNRPALLDTVNRLARGRTREVASFTAPPSLASLPSKYSVLLEEIKSRLRSACVHIVLVANLIVIEAFWQVEKIILSRQRKANWGAKLIDCLVFDLREVLPDMRGLSTRIILSMMLFSEGFHQGPITKQFVSQLAWGQRLRRARL